MTEDLAEVLQALAWTASRPPPSATASRTGPLPQLGDVDPLRLVTSSTGGSAARALTAVTNSSDAGTEK